MVALWPLSGFVPLSIVCLGAQSVLPRRYLSPLGRMGRRVLSLISSASAKAPCVLFYIVGIFENDSM